MKGRKRRTIRRIDAIRATKRDWRNEMNAMWWVHYTDKKAPQLGQQLLSLSSPDFADPRKAHKRARDTAKARLAKRGVVAVNLTSRCVG